MTRIKTGMIHLAVTLLFAANAIGAPPVDFQRDVQPILAEHCIQCHGADQKHRKAKLRLDVREDALKGGSSGLAAIAPGQPEKSELFSRISSHDANEVMPPPDQKKPLTAAQIQIVKQWITEGAKYEAHWAFVPPRKAPLPSTGSKSPIDALVMSRLKQEKLAASPPASKATLCRRLYLDLIGLPPSPDELASFERDGIDATIDRLLKSDRYGEKWARHWLDLARYSDTNGYEKDLRREMWVWRDWVIESFNQDMPYDQFIIEQIAGDLLPQAKQKQVIATGFLRNSMINEEGAIVPEQFRMVEMFDRIDCIGKSVLGVTTQCAQCHTHKFDPLTQREYYGMFAFLNNSYEAQSWVYTPEQLQQIEQIRGKIRGLEDRIRAQRPSWEAELASWAKDITSKQVEWKPLEAIELGSISGLNHPTQEADKSLLMKGHGSDDVFMIAAPSLKGVTGLRLEALNHYDLPHGGPGRSREGTWAMKELEVFIKKPDSSKWEKLNLTNATTDFPIADQKQTDGKPSPNGVSNLIDGKDNTVWNADRGHGLRNQPSVAVVQFEQPITFPDGTQMKVAWRMGEMLGCCRISVTTGSAPRAPSVDHAAVLGLQMPAGMRSADQRRSIFAAWRRSVPELKSINEEMDGLMRSMPVAATTILHLAERELVNERKTHLLYRGEWDQSREIVPPGTPAALHAFHADWPRNRLGFAQWLTDPRSPLTARVAVNQVWQAIFGAGLVETAEDFGTRAPVPEYRDLLDWLAVDFMEHQWSAST